jgi:dethiobiotin synthetase
MARSLFVTATDTGAGKTLTACAILLRARQEGLGAAGYKPVASGSVRTPQGLRNDDALALQSVSAPGLDYAAINPYCFEPPIAPHLAAAAAGVRIEPARLDAAHDELAATHSLVVVEGAGGWQVPLNEDIGFADWVAGRGFPVVLVVAMRLGCINHALLSAESILRRGRLLGWIANTLPPVMDQLEGNLESLRRRLPVPLLGVIPVDASLEQAAARLDWAALDRSLPQMGLQADVAARFTPADAAP